MKILQPLSFVFCSISRFRPLFLTGIILTSLVVHPFQFASAEGCAARLMQVQVEVNYVEVQGDFASAIGCSNNIAVVGAPNQASGGIPGAGRAYLDNALTGAQLATLSDPAPVQNGQFGFSVGISGNLAVVGAPSNMPGGLHAEGTAYVFNVTTWTLVATLNDPAPAEGNNFGSSVAISGTKAVVGSPGANGGAGVAFVFDATTGNWVATLANPAPLPMIHMGFSVAISNNLAIVGVPQADPGGITDAGIAHVFDATTGVLNKTLNNPTPTAGDNFGGSVAIDGNTAVVGAPFASPGGMAETGSAFIFDATTGSSMATLGSPTPAAGHNFGESVAISGNTVMVGAPGASSGEATIQALAYFFDLSIGINLGSVGDPGLVLSDDFAHAVALDGNVAVVGAPKADPGGVTDAGAAYCYVCPGTCTPDTPLTTLNGPSLMTGYEFSRSLGISGKWAVVGEPTSDAGGQTGAGNAFIYDDLANLDVLDLKGGLLTTLNDPAPRTYGQFGSSVGITVNTIPPLAVVGALEDGDDYEGAAYVFNARTGALVSTLTNPNPDFFDYFGYAVAIDGNLVVVGSPHDGPGGVSQAGTAYVFNATTGALIITLNNPAPGAFDWFGYSVAIEGNVAVVGRPRTFASAPGIVYVFNATTGTLISTQHNPVPSVGDGFGYAVAISGARVAVGSPNDSTGGVGYAGKAFVMDARSTDTLLATLNNPAPVVNDNFGNAIAIDQDQVVVGSAYDAPGGVGYAGSAYVFDAATGALTATLNNPTPEANDEFGYAVGISANTVVVGAPGDSPGGVSGAGTGYAFTCSSQLPNNNAAFPYHTIPGQLSANQGMTVGIYANNNGNTTWTPSPTTLSLQTDYALRITTDTCNLFGGVGQLNLVSGSRVTPGNTYVFSGVIQAPSVPSAGCKVGMEMIQYGVPFGSPLNLNVDVVAATPTPNAARDWEIYE